MRTLAYISDGWLAALVVHMETKWIVSGEDDIVKLGRLSRLPAEYLRHLRDYCDFDFPL